MTRPYGRAKYAARCTADYGGETEGRAWRVKAGEVRCFSTEQARAVFLRSPFAAGKWEGIMT